MARQKLLKIQLTSRLRNIVKMVQYFSNYVVTFKLKKMFFVCGFACECSANRGLEKVSDPVELKLQEVMDSWTWC